MDDDKIIMTETQKCRVYCLRKYYECFEKNDCYQKENKHRIEYCKKDYKECMRYSMEMMRKIELDDFIPTGEILGFR